MSSSSNHFPPQPLFAPASQQDNASDDFDLNEIFAEYFINEFEDPLNAYTGGMANYGGAVNSVAMTQQDNMNGGIIGGAGGGASISGGGGGGGMAAGSLPTGGIRTAFHHHTSSDPAQPKAKKVKLEETNNTNALAAVAAAVAPTPLNAMFAQQQQQQQQALGMAQLVPNTTQQMTSPTITTTAQSGGGGGGAQVSLPVGVGIRLGGVGGVAPATATLQMGQQLGGAAVTVPGNQYSHNIVWAPNKGNEQDGAMSAQAIAERRQRNREHAKRSRVRKKFMLESLQEQVRKLQKENNDLRMLVQEHIPEHAMQIISDCCSKNQLFTDGKDAVPNMSRGQKESLVRSDFSLMTALMSGQKCFVLSDPKLPDNPIVFATNDFYKLTGYTSKEVLGRNCRFLQGPGTDKRAVDIIRKAVATGSDATVCLLNYKADGTPFWNQFFIAALRDSDNNIVNFVGVQTEVEPEAASASHLEDRVNAVLPLQGKDDETQPHQGEK